MQSRLPPYVLLTVALSFAAALAGCADSSSELPADQGTLELPLTSTTGDGTVYRLSSATFEITGPAGTQVVDGNAAVPSVSVELPPGLTSVLLRPSWVLTRSTDGGSTFAQVDALLGTANPFAFRVLADSAQTISFNFLVRNPNGQINVRFGVDDSLRQLAGGVRVSNAVPPTGALAPYTNARLDFSTYFSLAGVQHRIEADGAKTSRYWSSSTATEFFNDALGVLAGQVGPAFAGGYVEVRVTAKTDGTLEVAGSIDGFVDPFPSLQFGPATMVNPVALDAQGFPADAFFLEVVPFSLSLSDASGSTASGTLTLRNLLPD
jgi:hypothetical protein